MARRRFQRGSLIAEGNWWRLRYYEDVIGADGSQARPRASEPIGLRVGPDAITQKQARRLMADFMEKVNRQDIQPASLMTVEAFVEKHFVPDHVSTLKPSGKVHYAGHLKHVLAAIGPLTLRAVNQQHAQQICSGMLQKTYTVGKKTPRTVKYSVQTVLHVRNVISAVFEHAKRLGLYPKENPARYVRLPEMTRKPKHALSADQVRKLLAVLPSPTRELAHLAVLTSMNIAELCGLKWKDINLTRQWVISDGEPVPPLALAVRRQYRVGEYGTLKAGSRRRDLPLTEQMIQLLRGLGKKRFPDSPVFASKKGTPIDSHNLFNRHLKPKGKELGMPWLGWHTLRHTHATLLRQERAGVNDQVAMMGHADARMTQRYGFEDLNRRRGIVQRIGAKVAPRKAKRAAV